jgi:glutathione peroxidase
MSGFLAAFRHILKINKFTVLKNQTNNLPPVSPFDISFNHANGERATLAEYRGKFILIVNVASKCGYTPQYAALETLYQGNKERLVILGFPSNDFLGQEPGTEKEIVQFCTLEYGVTFPITAKVHVTGIEKHPLFNWLSDPDLNGWNRRSPVWNFTKYLISPEGKLVAVFSPDVKPDDPRIATFFSPRHSS